MAMLLPLLFLSFVFSSVYSIKELEGIGNQDLAIELPASTDGGRGDGVITLTRAIQTPRTNVEIERVEDFAPERPAFTIADGNGKMRVFSEPSIVSRHRWMTEDPRFRLEVDDEESKLEILTAVLGIFARENKTFDSVASSLLANENEWMDALVKAIIETELHVVQATIRKANEELLIKFIKSTQVRDLTVEEAVPHLTDSFFRDSTVKFMTNLALKNVNSNDVTDESLGHLRADHLELGKAKKITQEGIRKFLKPALTGNVSIMSIKLEPSFKLDVKKLFKDLKVKEQPKYAIDKMKVRVWKVENVERPLEFKIETEGAVQRFIVTQKE